MKEERIATTMGYYTGAYLILATIFGIFWLIADTFEHALLAFAFVYVVNTAAQDWVEVTRAKVARRKREEN